MATKTILSSFFILFALSLSAQSFDSLKISKQDLPKDYSFTKKSECISVQACSFYDMTDSYAPIIGKVKHQEVQNFQSGSDSGSIMYFEYEGDFKGAGFLDGLLWGSDGKPSKEHPEEHLTKGNILIIWSFNKNSPLKKISQAKIKAKLK
jgi:hypothetical protein